MTPQTISVSATATASLSAAPALAPAIPISHQEHPFWNFDWNLLLKVLKVAATVTPAVVAIAAPGGAAQAGQLSTIAGAVLSEIQQEIQQEQILQKA